MYGGQVTCPLTLRLVSGGGRGYGPTHSQSLQKHFIGIPNLALFELSPFHDSLPLLREYEDNVMFETDFPHSTSLAPGPGSASPRPSDVIRSATDVVGLNGMQKLLSGNARRLYRR